MINEFDFGFDVRRQRGLDSLDEGPVADIRRVRGNMDDRFHMGTLETPANLLIELSTAGHLGGAQNSSQRSAQSRSFMSR